MLLFVLANFPHVLVQSLNSWHFFKYSISEVRECLHKEVVADYVEMFRVRMIGTVNRNKIITHIFCRRYMVTSTPSCTLARLPCTATFWELCCRLGFE